MTPAIPRRLFVFAAALLLLLMYALALTSMSGKAPTFDEQGFIVRGLAYLRGYTQIRVGHPLGLNALNAALLAGDSQVQLPLDDPSWSGTSFHRPAELFLWEIGNDVGHVMFLARLPSLWLGLLLAAFAARWARQLSGGPWPALLALAVIAADPNILAHMRLATTDLGLTAAALLAAYALWRFLRRPTAAAAVIAGAALGLLQNTKFTAGLFVPLFALVILLAVSLRWRGARADGRSLIAAAPWRMVALIVLVYPLAGLLTLWAAYGFEIGTLPADLPVLNTLSGFTLPLAHHLEQLLDIGGRLRVGAPSFLLGQYSDSGWWYYFPAAFLLKTPLPTLLLIAAGSAAFVACLWRRRCPYNLVDHAALLVPALGYFAIALTTDINLGYRHILPVLPLLVVFAAVSLPAQPFRPRLPRWWVRSGTVLALWLFVATLYIYPDFLAFFNVFAGGPANGWRSLVDSNLDWGQDLDELAPWMAANGVDTVWLSYFGEGRPAYYGIDYRGLDSFPPRLMNPQARPYYPVDPAPGIYAISATNLQGVHFADHEQFAWFRSREPLDNLGYSIYLYEVTPRGEPAALLLSGGQIDELAPEDYARLDTNDVLPRWIDLQQSLILPAREPAWLAQEPGQAPHSLLVPYLQNRLRATGETADYALSRYDPPPAPGAELAQLQLGEGRLSWRLADVAAADESEIVLLTAWQQQAQPQPLKLFIHVLDAEGRLVMQWDGLGAAWEGWRSGDVLLQVHALSWPEDTPPGSYRLLAGVYDPETGERWRTDRGAETLDLGTVTKP